MGTLNFNIILTSDGEPGSGFGTDLIDSLLPRDAAGRIMIPASHIKGLIRENLENLPDEVIPPAAVEQLFGTEDHIASLCHINNAVAPSDAKVFDITRTRLNDFKVADDGSLRTNEAIATGTRFAGSIVAHPHLSPPYVDLLKLGLLSLFAIGGSRNRGAGACRVTIDGEQRSPGTILRQLSRDGIDPGAATLAVQQPDIAFVDTPVMVKLIFKAANPICVPTIPVVKNNLISSGFSIPSSAVQGLILHRINDQTKKTATACFESPYFRAWPLNPSSDPNVLSFRVSFTHKISKLIVPETGNYHFEDEIIQPYDWEKVPSNSPLKSTDGVLLTDGTHVQLWKSSDMPRIISAHGVHHGDRNRTTGSPKRNLFTVESMAPVLFTGMVFMPQTAAHLMLESLEKDPFVQLGKSRSIRGGGTLEAQIVDFSALPIMKKHEKNVFILQSPVDVPKDLVHLPVEAILAELAASTGFGEIEKSSGALSIQFGWNRTVHNGFLGGRNVIAPGAVFKTRSNVDNLEQRLLAGLGKGRKQGFGSIIPHPGVAQRLYPELPKPKTVSGTDKNFGLAGYRLWQKARSSCLSTSQISRVRELAGLDPAKAIAYLKRQQTDRPETIWGRWKDVTEEIQKGIRDDAVYMQRVLKVCQDLLVADKGEG
ncbi:MAG: hypothetical protein RQ739_15050 [Desulfotignum sp.]|nr:hypothetical protein [Desulfotignum sp.]